MKIEGILSISKGLMAKINHIFYGSQCILHYKDCNFCVNWHVVHNFTFLLGVDDPKTEAAKRYNRVSFEDSDHVFKPLPFFFLYLRNIITQFMESEKAKRFLGTQNASIVSIGGGDQSVENSQFMGRDGPKILKKRGGQTSHVFLGDKLLTC